MKLERAPMASRLEAVEQLGKSSRRAGIASLLGAIIVVGSLVYSALKLHALQQSVQAAEQELEAKKKQLQGLDAEIKEKQAQAQALQRTMLRIGSASTQSGQQVQEAFRAEIASRPETAQLLARVWLHIRDESQRAKAKTVAQALVTAGFSVPGIEMVGDKSPKENQVRYFEKNDQVTKDCDAIVDVAAKMNITLKKQYIPPSPDLVAIQARHYEIFFGPDF
jgi:septal ring factor EnvC (AmiA/AmiB activator)